MEKIDFKALKDIITRNTDKRVFLTFHSIGDTDSVSSAFGIARLFNNATIATPDFITGNSRRILEKLEFDINMIEKGFDEKADMVVLLDVNNFEDCGSFAAPLRAFKGTILIIDHHTPNNIAKDNVFAFNNESYNSAASIVYDLIKSAGVSVNKNLAKLIAIGIISDSAELRNAFPKTFIQIGELLQNGGTDYQMLIFELQHIASIKTRSDFVKDLFNSRVVLKSNLLMLHGIVRIHANKIADDAIKIGADVSIFYTCNKKEVSFSARMRPPLDKKYKINLGKIMKSLAPIINGHGGGHPCAAGAYGSNMSNASAFMEAFIEEINRKFSQ
jgi:bifunctional oligoribonuclease and PAP phosphatase NrnA